MKVAWLMIAVLLAGSLWAEALPDSPSPQKSNAAASGDWQAPPPAAGSMRARSLLAKSEKPVVDRNFKLANGAMFAAGIANVELAHQCVVSHSCYLDQLPSTSRLAMYGLTLSADMATMAIAYKLKKSGIRWWFVPPVLATAAQVYSAGHMVRRMSH